jgi:hypothetical protein
VADDVRLATRVFGDWSIKTGDQAATLDQLYRATQKSGVGLSDLMATVVQFGAPLRNMGFGFTDSVGMLAKWEKEGVNVTTVLAGMRFALGNFASEGIAPAKGFAKAIDDISAAKTRAAGIAIGKDIFGRKAVSDIVDAIRGGRLEYSKFADTIANGKDTIHTAAKDTEDLAESWTKMYNAMKVNVEPGLTGLFSGLSKLLDMGQVNINPWFHDMEGEIGLLRSHLREPMYVGHVKNALWIKGIDQAVTREQYFRGIMKTPMAVGHVQNALWLSGINQGLTRAQYFRSFIANPMAVGHLNTGGWTGGISQAQAAFNAFKSGVQANMYVGHIIAPPMPRMASAHALGGVFRSPHLSITAEAGPEAIIPLNNPRRAAQVMDEAGLTGRGGGAPVAARGGDTTYNVNVNLDGIFESGEDAGAAAADAFTQRTREVARGY